MEVTQFTYFQQVGGLDCKPVTAEITYGLERIAMYLQEKDNVYDILWNKDITYGDIFQKAEYEHSKYNFEESEPDMLFELFNIYEKESKRLINKNLILPSYEYILKCSHTFNLLTARGAISVTERARYIGRIRNLAKIVADAYVEQRKELGFPLLSKGGKIDE